MQYLLVIQFSEEVFSDFDLLIEFEDGLIEALGDKGDVDGHDIGVGEVNFFIFTDDHHGSFERVSEYCSRVDTSGMKVAFRNVDGEDYTSIWPTTQDGQFSVA